MNYDQFRVVKARSLQYRLQARRLREEARTTVRHSERLHAWSREIRARADPGVPPDQHPPSA